jgi:Ni,Fe-hydrogenase maturation factor
VSPVAAEPLNQDDGFGHRVVQALAVEVEVHEMERVPSRVSMNGI